MTTFVRFIEIDKDAGGMVSYFIPVQGNEADLEAFEKLLRKTEFLCGGSRNSRYSCLMDLTREYSEDYVNAKTEQAERSFRERGFAQTDVKMEGRFEFIETFKKILHEKAVDRTVWELMFCFNSWPRYFDPTPLNSKTFARISKGNYGEPMTIYIEEEGNEEALDHFSNEHRAVTSFVVERGVCLNDAESVRNFKIYGKFEFDAVVEITKKKRELEIFQDAIRNRQIYRFF